MLRKCLLVQLCTAVCISAAASTPKGCVDEAGEGHPLHSKWQPNACTFCECPKAGVAPKCAVQSCAVLECPDNKVPELPSETKCCATTCVDVSEAFFGDCNTVCNTKWDPICGTDGSTYTNKCFFELAQCARSDKNFEIAHKGVCTEEEEQKAARYNNKSATTGTAAATPTDSSAPVAAAMSSVPTSGPATDCAAVTCAPRQKCGPGFRLKADEANPCCKTCVADTMCPKICLKTFDAVCGSDGETYASYCDMMSTTCQEGKDVTLMSNGKCPPSAPIIVPAHEDPDGCGQVACTLEYLPVCGSDGNTYDNMCKLGVESCVASKSSSTLLYVAHAGPCQTATSAAPAPAPTSTSGSVSGSGVQTSSDSSSSTTTAIIVSCVFGALALVAVMGGAAFLYLRQTKRGKARNAAPSVSPSEMPINHNASGMQGAGDHQGESGKKVPA